MFYVTPDLSYATTINREGGREKGRVKVINEMRWEKKEVDFPCSARRSGIYRRDNILTVDVFPERSTVNHEGLVCSINGFIEMSNSDVS